MKNKLLYWIVGSCWLGMSLGVMAQTNSSSSSATAGSKSVVDVIAQDSTPLAKDIRPEDMVQWTVLSANEDSKASLVRIEVQLVTKNNFSIYSDKISWLPKDTLDPVVLSTPPLRRQTDPMTGNPTEVFLPGVFTLEFPVVAGERSQLSFGVKFVACTEVICLFPYTTNLTASWTASSTASRNTTNTNADPTDQPTKLADLSVANTPSPDLSTDARSTDPSSVNPSAQIIPPSAGTFEERVAKQVQAGTLGFGMLLLLAFIGGILTNLTPCVAPMIPITIRLLGRQTGNPFVGSSMYALGIMITYTSLGLIAALSGALFGNFMANPWVSIGFGLVMALLGFSMLGFGDLSKIQNFGNRIGANSTGPMNAFFMGTGAGLVASPCTGPILAALLAYTAGRSSMIESVSLLATYSAGFSIPYIFLGASAAKVSQIRVNPLVQVSVKFFFAAVMFGLSFYFLRIPLYSFLQTIAPYIVTLAWVFVAIGLALMAWLLASHERQINKVLHIVPAFVLGFGLFATFQSIMSAPKSEASAQKLEWYKIEEEAYAAAKLQNKPLLVDGWAEWCQACKEMDVTTFVDPSVVEELSNNWILLKFDLTESNEENDKIQEKYKLTGLPTVTFVPPDGDLNKKNAFNGKMSVEAMLSETKQFRSNLRSNIRSNIRSTLEQR